MGLFWAYQWLSPEAANISGRLFGLIEYGHLSPVTDPTYGVHTSTNKGSEDLALTHS